MLSDVNVFTVGKVYAHFVFSGGTTVLLLASNASVARKCCPSQVFSQRHLLASNAPVTRKCCSSQASILRNPRHLCDVECDVNDRKKLYAKM